MNEKKELKKDQMSPDICSAVRAKLEAALELGGPEVDHLQNCRECSAFFQRIEDRVAGLAHEKILKLNRIKLAGSFAGRHSDSYNRKKRSFFFAHASAYALVLVFLAGFMWMVSSSLYNTKNSDYVDLERSEEIQKRSYISYSAYLKGLNEYYERVYENEYETEYSQSFISGGEQVLASGAQDSDADVFGGVIIFEDYESGILAQNTVNDLGDYYVESIRYLSDYNESTQ
jgi:hypothetical protein